MTAFGIVSCLASLPVRADEPPQVMLRAEVAPKEIHIGDRVGVTLGAMYSGPIRPGEQKFPPTLGDFEVLGSAALPTKPDNSGKQTVMYRLVLTTFSTGTVTIPAIPLVFQKSDGTMVEARTTAVPITVKSVLAEQGDQGGLKPAKGLYNFRSWLWVWILLGAVAVALIAWLIGRRQGRAAGAAERQEPLLSPEDEAREALAALEGEPVNEETIKEFYFRLSRILRRYIERRYFVSALEMTSSELLAAVRRLDLPLAASQPIRDFIQSADLVKFAKVMPNPEEIPADVGRVRSFVETTTPKPVAPEDEKAARAGEAPPV